MHSKEPSAPKGLDALWGTARAGARGPAARYDASDIAEAAVALADRAGADAVTLAAVARELGLTTTALYRYVEAKDVLVELMLDRAVGAAPRLGEQPWRDAVHRWANALAERYRLHPWLATVALAGMPRRPAVYAWLDELSAALSDAPLRVEPLRLALVVDAVVRGIAPLAVAPAPEASWLDGAVRSRFPGLAARLARDWRDVDDELTAAVDLVLDGAARP